MTTAGSLPAAAHFNYRWRLELEFVPYRSGQAARALVEGFDRGRIEQRQFAAGEAQAVGVGCEFQPNVQTWRIGNWHPTRGLDTRP